MTAILAMAVLGALVSGCASQPPSPTAAPGDELPAEASVTVKNFAFDPAAVIIRQGGTVTWTNLDSAEHTVKFGDSESDRLGAGGKYVKKFEAVGTYEYICGPHPFMKGSVEVKP